METFPDIPGSEDLTIANDLSLKSNSQSFSVFETEILQF